MSVTPRGEWEPDPELFRRLQEHVAADYTVESELGGGGMSRVFVAHERELNRRVVIKVLPTSLAATVSAERFRREIMVSARLQHPQIVPVLTSGELDGLPYFIMPFIDGESLRTRIQRGPLSVRETVNILRDVARALAFANRAGVVHRDIKPDNILLAGGSAVVTDFGVAKAITDARTANQQRAATTITAVGVSLGTPQYMAPEQVAADPSADHRVDLYALGVVGYEMLAGVPPFHGLGPSDLLRAQLTQPPPPLAGRRYDVPTALNELVMKCLEKDPAARPGSAADILRALESPEVVSGAFATPKVRRRMSSGAVLALTGVLAAAALAAAMFLSRSSPSASLSRQGLTLQMVPFETGGAGPDSSLPHEVFADLAGALRTIDGLTVAETFEARGAIGDSSAAAERTLLLRGTMQRSGERVRVNLRLTDGKRDSTIWSGRFEGNATNILAFEDQIAAAAIAGIKKQGPGVK